MKLNLSYATWVDDNKEFLESFSKKRVFVTYAGGKDASVILHYLIQAKVDFGFDFETHVAMFPKHVYTNSEVHKLDSYWKDRGIHINWHPINENEEAFETARQSGTNPCEICHLTKREACLQYLNSTVDSWDSLVIIVGWSLWDLVGYSLEYLLGGIYTKNNNMFQGKTIEERHLRTSQRFYPMLKMKEGYSLYKPLLRYNDQDILQVIQENQIPLLNTDCKYKDFRPKRLFSECYTKMGMHFDYDKVLTFAREALNLIPSSSYTSIDKKVFIKSIF
jgi:3'-phosphoadenosine 5'-phosphosulfate sulfotransferase (PAPS reductase)/FAD synthetase